MKVRLIVLAIAVFGWGSQPQPAQAFQLLGYVWKSATSTTPTIQWALDPTLPSSVTKTTVQIRANIAAAVATWEGVTTSYLQFAEGSQPADPDNLSGSYRIFFQVLDVAVSTGGCPGISLTGGIPFDCTGSRVRLSSSTIENGTDESIEFVIAHEVGHAIGIHHSDRPSIMAYHRTEGSLTSDDWAALSYLYPNGEVKEYAPLGCASLAVVGKGKGPPGGFGGGSSGGPTAPAALGFAVPWLLILLIYCGLRRPSRRLRAAPASI